MTPTPLQDRLRRTIGELLEARETLDDDAYAAFIAIVLRRAIREQSRLVFGEAVRSLRDDPLREPEL